MSILTAQNVSKSFAAEEVFSGISVQVPHNARIALVGPNGAGKTTLINILIGRDAPTDGSVQTKRGLTMGYLPQRPELHGEHTIWEEMLTAIQPLLETEARLQELEHQLADPAYEDQHDDILERYGRLQQKFEEAGGYTYEYDIKRVLHGLSFDIEDFDHPIAQLSGGQKTRVFLARLLIEQPDLLVLDEPTNHLDIQAVEWLEGYLKGLPSALLMVSHDRYFMDKVANTIWELDYGELETYNGNYSHYVNQREERYERLLKEFEAQQAFIKKEQDYIQRNIAGQNTAQAKGRRRRLERMMEGSTRLDANTTDWLIKAPNRRKPMKIAMNAEGRTGNEVLRVNDLQVGYDAPLFDVDEIVLLRQEVAAIIGPNGAGKSTFLKTILEKLPALGGKYKWGSNVKIGYFAQAHETLNENNTILDELLTVKNLQISEARSYLAAYLFTGDDVYRTISTLSGGERGRVALAKLALAGTNVLLLDEPTNHLDIPAQEVLQTVLADYEGTILLVSHDRYIIDALATQIWHITHGNMTIFKGSYAEYVADREATATIPENENGIQSGAVSNGNGSSGNTTAASAHPSGLNDYQRQKRLAALEKTIHGLEAQIASLEAEIASASANGDMAKVAELGQQYSEAEQQLEMQMDEWLQLS